MNPNIYYQPKLESTSGVSKDKVGDHPQNSQEKPTIFQPYQQCTSNQPYYHGLMYQQPNIMNNNSSTFPSTVPVCGGAVVPVIPVMPYYPYTPGYQIGFPAVMQGHTQAGASSQPNYFYLMQSGQQINVSDNQQQQIRNQLQTEQKSIQNQENMKSEQMGNNFYYTKIEGSQTTELAISSQLSILNNLNERYQQKESKEVNNFSEFSKESSQSIIQTQLRNQISDEDQTSKKRYKRSTSSNNKSFEIKYEEEVGQSNKSQKPNQLHQQVIPMNKYKQNQQTNEKSAISAQSYQLSYDNHSKSSSESNQLKSKQQKEKSSVKYNNQSVQQEDHQKKNSKKTKSQEKEINEKIFLKTCHVKMDDKFNSSVSNNNTCLDSDLNNKSEIEQYSPHSSNYRLQISSPSKNINIHENEIKSGHKNRLSKKQEKYLDKFSKHAQRATENQNKNENYSEIITSTQLTENQQNDEQKLTTTTIKDKYDQNQNQNQKIQIQTDYNSLYQMNQSETNLKNQQNLNKAQNKSILFQQATSEIKQKIHIDNQEIQKFKCAYKFEDKNPINQASLLQNQHLNIKKQETISDKNSMTEPKINEHPYNHYQGFEQDSEIEVSIDFDEIESNQEQINNQLKEQAATKKSQIQSVKNSSNQIQNILEDYHMHSPKIKKTETTKTNKRQGIQKKNILDIQSSNSEQPVEQKKSMYQKKQQSNNKQQYKNQENSQNSQFEKQSQSASYISKQQQNQSNNQKALSEDEIFENNSSLQEEYMKKGNCVKNVIKAFQNWCKQDITDEIVQQHCPLDIEEGLTPNQVKKKLNRYIKQKTPNHQNLQRLIDHHRFKLIFLHFLQVPAQKWIETSTIKDKIQHQQFITFIVENWDQPEQLECFMKILKRKKNLVTNKELLLDDKQFNDSQYF